MEGWMEEKTEGLKCMDGCRDGWMDGRIQVYRSKNQKKFYWV